MCHALQFLGAFVLFFKVKPPVFFGENMLLPMITMGGLVQGLPLQVETHLEQRELLSPWS